MALDPQLALDVKVPTVSNPIETMTQLESVKALRDQREALAEQRQQTARKLIQDAQDKAALNAAVQAANGNPVEASKSLRASGRATVADQLDAITAKNQQAQEQAVETHLKNQGMANDHALSMLQTATPENWPIVRGAVIGMAGAVDPNSSQTFDQLLPKQFDQNTVDAVIKGGQSHKEYVDSNLNALKELQSGNMQQGIALALSKAPDQTQGDMLGKKDVLASIASMYHLTPEAMLPWAQLVASGAHGDDFLKATVPEAKKEELSAAAAKEAEASKDRAAQLKIAQQNADANTFRAHNPASAMTTPVDPEVVAGYVRQVKNGSLPLQNIPAHAKDAVMKSLEASGENITQLTSQGKQMKETATTLLPMIDKVESLAKQLDQQGLMGTLGGRARNIAGVESAAADIQGLKPEQRKLIGEFASAGGLLITGIARAHGGARAGGSPQMIEHLSKLMDAKDKDINTFLGNLQGERDFMNAYANMGPSSNTSSQAPADYRMVNGKLVKVGGS